MESEAIMLFVYPPSDILLCPLHKGFFRSAVIAKCGHTFCRQCIISHLRSHADCPLDQVRLKAEELIPNLAVSCQVNDLLIRCKYGCKKVNGELVADPEGCQAQIKLGNRNEHEDKCDYADARCPYSHSCPPLRRTTLTEHLKTCTHVPCPHRAAGCTFEGTKQGLDEHLTVCAYESIKDYISHNQEQLEVLKAQLEQKNSENDFLKKSVVQLTSRFEQLAVKLESKNTKFEGSLRHLTASLEATQSQLSEALADISVLRKHLDRAPPAEELDLAAQTPQLMKCKGTFTGHAGPIWAMAVGLGYLISGSSDTTIKLWDLGSFKCKQTLQGHEGIVHSLACIGTKLFSGSDDKKIRVWDLESMECLRVLEDHDYTVCALVVSAGFLFSGSYTHIKVWDLETYQCIQTLKGHNHWVRAITVSGGFLFSGSYNIIKIWDLGTFQCVKTITGQSGSIYSLAVAARKLMAGTYENAIVIWDLDSYEMTHTLSGHIGAVYGLAVIGNRFFSASYDSTIKMWNLDTMLCVQTLNRHTSSVDTLVAHHGSIFSGSADNSIKVWR